MRIKCCGLKYRDNTLQVEAANVDYLGFIFCHGSKRKMHSIPMKKGTAKRVGVFVNESAETVIETSKKYALDYAQLHGSEPPEYVLQLSKHMKVIKAFSIDDDFSFDVCMKYSNCAFFIFDTKGTLSGGNGTKFNWSILNKYKGETPFLLSGGISPHDAAEIKKIDHSKMFGVDINSGFESSPGVKITGQIINFKTELNEV